VDTVRETVDPCEQNQASKLEQVAVTQAVKAEYGSLAE